MSIEEVIRAAVREEVEPLRRAIEELRPAASAGSGPLSVEQVAAACHVEPATVRAWISSGLLAASKPRRRWLVERAELDRFRAAQRERVPEVSTQVTNIMSRLGRRNR